MRLKLDGLVELGGKHHWRVQVELTNVTTPDDWQAQIVAIFKGLIDMVNDADSLAAAVEAGDLVLYEDGNFEIIGRKH